MLNDIHEILYDAEQIQHKVKELGEQLSRDFKDRNPLVICILKGAFIFMADLVKAMDIPLEIDFMAVSSYGSSTKSSGVVKIVKDLDTPVEGRDVLIVEDIIDSGHTLNYLVRILQERQPASLRIVTLLDKPERREVAHHVDWVGFSIPNDFVVGYGLDYNELYRNLPYIGVLRPAVYAAPEQESAQK